MRIWYQGLMEYGKFPEYQTMLASHLKRVARSDTDIEVHGLLPKTFESDYAIVDLQYGPLAYFHHGQVLAAAVSAERNGFDAFVMSFLNRGLLDEIRSVVDIPVTNYGEAAIRMATLYGYRFGFLRFAEGVNERLVEFIDQNGQTKNFAGVMAAGFTFEELKAGLIKPAPVIAKFRESAAAFARRTGADVIIAGEMPLNVFLASNGVHRVGDIPVLDGCGMVVALAEVMADFSRKFGLRHSRSGQKSQSVSKERLAEVVKFYGLETVWQRIGALPLNKS